MSLAAKMMRKVGIARVPLPGMLRLPRDRASKVFLTFDDGPDARYTPYILELLAAYKARATFFVAGCRAQHVPKLLRRIVDEGHLLANHAFTLAPLCTHSIEKAMEEVNQCQALIEKVGGQRLIRPPNGLIGPRLYWRLVRSGFQIDYWSLDSDDSLDVPGKELGERLVKGNPLGQVILFHDDRTNGLEALEIFLSRTRDRGYQFAPLVELPAVRQPSVVSK